MKGNEKKLAKYMDGSGKRFIIPVYQRNYDWKESHCKQLYDDLVDIIRNQRRSHFFGSIVSAHNEDGNIEEYLIIDGQQRLTTVSLLLLALHNLIEQGKIVSSDKQLSTKIYEDYLVDKWEPKETRIKLKSVKNDRFAFSKLFEEEQEYVKGSNLTVNYRYFYNRIQQEEITADQLYQAIRSLEIIEITLNSEDNPQLIFESLNSTGLDLTEGDKIRNYVLMGLPPKKQEAFYEKYWNKIEENTNYQVGMFVRDYLSVKQSAIPKQKAVYFAFKNYVKGGNLETESLLTDLLHYSKLYQILLTGDINDSRISSCIDRLNRLETTVTRPFFLEVLRLNKGESLNDNETQLSMDETASIFHITESYLFRRIICELPTNELNKVFVSLHKEISRYEDGSVSYVDKLIYALKSTRQRARFPNDTEFKEALGTRQIYSMTPKNKIYILERFENFGTKEDKDVYRHVEDGTYSIEHIMPQSLSPSWAESLGDEYKQIHDTWLHRLANLTLTGYNSKYSNNSFLEKRDMKNGFVQSGLKMNQWIAKQPQWGEHELVLRNRMLQNQALEIWPLPKTNYSPEKKQLEFYTLEDDTELSGRKIASFEFGTMRQNVRNWVDMFERIVHVLHSENKTVLNQLASESEGTSDLSAYFSYNRSDLRECLEIENGLYVERNSSTQSKLSILRKLFVRYNRDPSDLVFYLREEDDANKEEDLARYDLRKRFWTYALPFIKDANSENNAFKNCNPVVANWLNGWFGISGFELHCVGNYDTVRAGIRFSRSEAEDNKNGFDLLAAHKAEIESALGEKLVWDRGDNKKSSCVYFESNEFGIENEDDWGKAAKFLAKWSLKFYSSVVVPYLIPAYLSSNTDNETHSTGVYNPVKPDLTEISHKNYAPTAQPEDPKDKTFLFNMRVGSEDKKCIQEEVEKEGMTFQDYAVKAVRLRLMGKPPIKVFSRKQYSDLNAVITCRFTAGQKRRIKAAARVTGMSASAFVLGAIFGSYESMSPVKVQVEDKEPFGRDSDRENADANKIYLFNMRIGSEDKYRIQSELRVARLTFQDYVLEAISRRLAGDKPKLRIPRTQLNDLDNVITCRLTGKQKRKVIEAAKAVGLTASAFVLGAVFGDY